LGAEDTVAREEEDAQREVGAADDEPGREHAQTGAWPFVVDCEEQPRSIDARAHGVAPPTRIDVT